MTQPTNPIAELLMTLQKWQESIPPTDSDMQALPTSMLMTHLTAVGMWMTQLEHIGMMMVQANSGDDIEAIKLRMTNIARDVQNIEARLSNELDLRVPPRVGAI